MGPTFFKCFLLVLLLRASFGKLFGGNFHDDPSTRRCHVRSDDDDDDDDVAGKD